MFLLSSSPDDRSIYEPYSLQPLCISSHLIILAHKANRCNPSLRTLPTFPSQCNIPHHLTIHNLQSKLPIQYTPSNQTHPITSLPGISVPPFNPPPVVCRTGPSESEPESFMCLISFSRLHESESRIGRGNGNGNGNESEREIFAICNKMFGDGGGGV